VSLLITGGERHEAPVLAEVFAALPPTPSLAKAVMDKGDDRDPIRAQLQASGIAPVIPPKKNRKISLDYDQETDKLREKVERFFKKMKQFRSIATRYEKLGHIFLAFLHIVAAFLIIK
jgi:putative transposase